MAKPQIKVEWTDGGRQPKNPSNPDYPEGIHIDMAGGALPSCTTELRPYPTPGCGMFVVTCKRCGVKVAITTAGRPDDPTGITLKCLRPNADGDGITRIRSDHRGAWG